jgi:hypothetical protein
LLTGHRTGYSGHQQGVKRWHMCCTARLHQTNLHFASKTTTAALHISESAAHTRLGGAMEADPFSRALSALASPSIDPNARRDAETFVTAASEDPAVVLALLQHLDPGAPVPVAPETRHLAAVLLATAAGKHWRALDDASRKATQTSVLAALANAEDPATLRALAHAADVVAQSSTTTGTAWDDLLPSLSEAARSPKDAHREAASLLLGNLVESMGNHLKDHHRSLVDLFVEASKDECDTSNQTNPNTRRRARRAALGALAQLATAVGEGGDFPLVAELAPRILERCLHAAVEYSSCGDLVGVAATLRALAAAVAVDADAVFGHDLQLLYPAAETTLAVATRGYVGNDNRVVANADQDLIDDARAAAFEALEALVSTHSGALDEPVPSVAAAAAATGVSASHAPPTIAAMLLPPLCAAARDDGAPPGFGNDDSETVGVAAAARAALRQCALRFPPSVVLPQVLGPVVEAGSLNKTPTAGALGAFAVVIEGCAHDVADDDATVRHILTALRCGVESGDASTSRAAALVLSELTEHAGHALASLHATQVASLLVVAIRVSTDAESRLGLIDGANDAIDLVEGFAAPAHAATVSFVENCGDEELDPETWRALAGSLVGGACAESTRSRGRARCLGTLAAVATAAASQFEPYAGETLSALAKLAGSGTAPGEEAADAVRARALAAMAAVVAATGEHAAPAGTVDALLDAATRRLSESAATSSSTSRECSLRVFARLAVALDRRLAPWLPGATAAAIAVLEVSVGAEAAPGGGRRGRTAVTTGDIGEAIAAAETLGALANMCGAATRGTSAQVLAALVAAADPEGSAPPALRIAALRALEFATHPADEDAETGTSAMVAVAPEEAAALFVDTTRALAGSLARDEAPEAALAAAASLETVAERCRGVAVALAAAPALSSALTAAVAEAVQACDAVREGVSNCQAELADGGGGGHAGRDGEDTVDIFFDLEDQAKRVLARLK